MASKSDMLFEINDYVLEAVKKINFLSPQIWIIFSL